MFRVMRIGPNRVDVEFEGKLDSDDMRRALHEFAEASRGVERGRMLYRVRNFELPTLGAIRIELSSMREMFRVFKRFERVAVVADKGWLRKISELEGLMFPHVTIKAFPPEQEAEAESWLT